MKLLRITLLFSIFCILYSCSNVIHRPISWKEPEQKQVTALKYLPKAKKGYVDWVAAMSEQVISPRNSITTYEKDIEPLDLDIVFTINNDFPLPNVVFPHKPHTQWLGCNNCHPSIFRMKAGSNPITMEAILKGEFCGRCHGKVAFAISDCTRCHSQRPKI